MTRIFIYIRIIHIHGTLAWEEDNVVFFVDKRSFETDRHRV